MGQHIVIVNELDVATELLEKRATKYSSRPQMFFATVTCKLKEWPGYLLPLLTSCPPNI